MCIVYIDTSVFFFDSLFPRRAWPLSKTSPGGGEGGAGVGCGAACLTPSATGAADQSNRCGCKSGRGGGGRVRDSGAGSPQNGTNGALQTIKPHYWRFRWFQVGEPPRSIYLYDFSPGTASSFQLKAKVDKKDSLTCWPKIPSGQWKIYEHPQFHPAYFFCRCRVESLDFPLMSSED